MMLKWKIMTYLLVLLCNIILGSAFFVVNCECDKNIKDYEDVTKTKISTRQMYKNIVQSVGTSFASTNSLFTTSELNGSHVKKIEFLDKIIQDMITEVTIPLSDPDTSPDPQPDPPHKLCLEEAQTTVDLQTISWPATVTGSEAVSNPLCLDENFVIMKRKCEDTWTTAPDCKKVQQAIKNPCPEDLTQYSDKYCYKIIEKTTFPPDCPYPETVGWDESIQLSLTTDPIWMPVIRDVTDEYGSDVLRFIELTENYEVPYEICTQSCRTYFYSGTFLDKLCQIYHNSTHIEAVSCDQQYSAVCVYHALPIRTKSFCSQAYSTADCKQSGYGTDSMCFCEAPNNNQVGPSVLAEFIFPYQNLIYTNLDTSCHIGLEKDINEEETPPAYFIWSAASHQNISYSNWAPDTNFDNMFGVITPDGWILEAEKDHGCLLYQISVSTGTGELKLDIEENEGYLFKLTIRNYKRFLSNDNGEPLVYCFTDADATSLIYRIDNFSKNLSEDEVDFTYKFSHLKTPQSGPGNYWCEAFLYPELKIIKSDIKILTNFEAEYVVILNLKQYEEKLSSYPLRAENFATLQNLFKNELVNPLSFFPRIMKLDNIDEDKAQLTVTFHLSSAEANNTEDVFNALKAASMAQTIFEFVDFRSVDYCHKIQTRQQIDGQIITWPYTRLNEVTDPENGFCVTDDVTFIQKECVGNFIDGAHWLEITDDCTFYASSVLTEELIQITKCTDMCDSALKDLLAITENYSFYNTLDLVLTIKFLKAIADQEPDLEIFAGIINNIMKISRPFLVSSQLNFKATDSLLLSLDEALENGDFTEYKTENFAIKTINCKNNGIYGIFLQNCSASYTDCDLVEINDLTLLNNETYISTHGVVAAIALSQKLYNQINTYSDTNSSYIPKVIVSIYYGSQLFIEKNVQKFSNYVFGVLFPDFIEEFAGPLSIYYYSNDKNNYLGYNCSYWDFDDPTFSSWADEGTENINQAVYCEFYHVTNFGIPSTLPHEYCGASKNSDRALENSNCLVKALNIDSHKNKSLVKYLSLCEFRAETDVEFEKSGFLGEALPCTILVMNSSSNKLSQFCYVGNATAILTKCFENFDFRANSFNITENCLRYLYSNLLGSIHELHDIENITDDDCWDSILDIVLTYSENYINFTDLDMFVVATVMNSVVYNKPDLQKLAGIVNNLMKVPSSTLSSAQRNFRAIDILLLNIEEILKDGDCSEWKTENFIIKCLDISTHTIGLYVTNCSNDFNDCNIFSVQFLDTMHNESYVDSNEIQATIYLTEALYNQITTYSSKNSSYKPKLILSLYSGPQLFVELDDSTINQDVFSFIFGILLPDFNEKFEGPIIVHYAINVTSENLLEYNCSYWKYDSNSYGSWMTEGIKANKQIATCEFYHVTNFAMPFKLLNYGQSVNFNEKQLSRLTNNNTCTLMSQGNPVNDIYFNNDDKTCAIRTERIEEFDNKCPINNFFSTILGKIGDKYTFLTPDNNLGFLGDIFPVFANEELITESAQYSISNQSVFCNNLIPTSFYNYLNYGTQYLNNFNKKSRNITNEVEKINSHVKSNNLDSIFTQLEQLLLNNSFNEDAIELIAILLQKVKLLKNVNSLEKLTNILDILMTVPKDTMYEAQTKFKSADKILYSIDNTIEDFETSILIQGENISFLVISKEDILTFHGFYVTKNKKIIYIENISENIDDAEMDIRVILSPQLHDQIKANRTRMIFVIFYSDIYFRDNDEDKVLKPMVEVLFPDLKDHLKAYFKISYQFEAHLNESSKCSYWDHIVTKNEVVKKGSWKKELPPEINGNWVTCTFSHATHFALVTSSPNITTDLEYILNSNLTGLEKLKQVDGITSKSHADLLPVDIFLISQIIGNSLTEGAVVNITSGIISNLFNVPHEVLRESQVAHTATDILLHNVDKMAGMLDDTFINNDNFSLIVKDLNTVNLTGVLLYNCSESKCNIDQLNGLINISHYDDDNDMSALLIFSPELVAQIRNLTSNTKVIISIYYSNVLFNEYDKERNTTKVFGVVFPGLNSSLDGQVSVIYNIGSATNEIHDCAYWYYNADPGGNMDNATFGQWINDTSKSYEGQVAICDFSHVTHFAMLLSNNANYNDHAILNIITYIGCFLSLLGILIIILTAMFFKKWRQNTGNKILINFSVAISLKIAMLYISEYVKSTSSAIGCTISGAILHYAILSECAWMLTIAILQFKRFVEVLGGPPKYILVKALICGWIFPAIPVLCVILIDSDNYIQGNAGICYPSNLGLYLGIWLPVVIIVSINCVIFIFIIYNVFHKKTEYIDNANYDILFQWRLALLLFFMLGLTWLFGFLGEIKGDELFAYVFSITASMQGFVLFLFFIVFNKSTRVLYSHSAKQWFYSKRIFKLWQTKSQNKY